MSYFRTTLLAFISIIFLGAPTANAESAKMFKLTANGDLSKVKGYNWSNRWAQIVPFSARGENLLLFYDRDRGLGKLFSYNGAGQMFRKKTFTGWSKDWDHVIAGQFGEANMIFYNRVNGRLKAFRISETGSMSLQFQQTIENPVDAPDWVKMDIFLKREPKDARNGPGGPGWDIVTPGRWSWVKGRTVPGLLFYNRTEGRALFLRYDEAENHFVFAHRYQGWNNSWDEIKAADFNSDQVDDLVLYDQDDGTLKIIYMNEDYSFKSHEFLKDSGGISTGRTHFPQLAIGNFGGGRGGKDVLLYQQDTCPRAGNRPGEAKACQNDDSPTIDFGRLGHGSCCETGGYAADHGRGLLWTDNGISGWNLDPKVYSNWSDDWTHVIPIKAKPTYYGSTGLLFYRNQVTLKLNIWRTIPEEYLGPNTSFQHRLTARNGRPWDTIQDGKLEEWIRALRNTYKAAGIEFDVTIESDIIYDDEIADGGCDVAKTYITGYVINSMPADQINVLVIPRTGLGCSWHSRNHALVGKTSLDNPKHLSHEVGHYLGLAHVAYEFGANAECKASLQECVIKMASRLTGLRSSLGRDVRFIDLDSDYKNWNGSWVYDTPPVLNQKFTNKLRQTTRSATPLNQNFPGNCNLGARYTFKYPLDIPEASQFSIEMYQNNHNVMSYTNCNGLFRISKDQARVIRQGLFRTGPFGTHKDGTPHSYGWRSGLIGN